MNATVAAEAPARFSMRLLERNWVPDALIRRGIRKLLAQRLREEDMGNPEAQQKRLMDLIARLKASPIAINTSDATILCQIPEKAYCFSHSWRVAIVQISGGNSAMPGRRIAIAARTHAAAIGA